MGAEDQADLEEQVAALTRRVWQLEQSLSQLHTEAMPAEPSTSTASSTGPVVASAIAEPDGEIKHQPVDKASTPAWPSARMPSFPASALGESTSSTSASFASPSPSTPSPSTPSLEARIGSQFFNRIGIFALLIGTAWFLKLAFDSHWIGPAGRILIGLAAGAALILWSERFRTKGYPAFAYSLKAVGSGVLYLSLWAAYSVFHLIPGSVAFVAMILVTAWNGFMAWVQDAELLAFYAIVGGFSTPLLLSTGENHELTLFAYLLILDVAVVALIALRPWSRLLLGAFLGTASFSVAWYWRFYDDSQFALTSSFAAAFFVLFAIAPRLMRERTAISTHDLVESPGTTHISVVLVLLPLANAAIGFAEFYAILNEPLRRWAQPWIAVAFAAFYLLLLQLRSPKLLQQQQTLLASLHLALAVAFLTIAIPLEARGHWITIGWLVEGVALLWAARRVRRRLLRVLAAGSLLLGFLSLLLADFDGQGPVIFNARFATYLTAIAAFAMAAYISAHAGGETQISPSEDKLSWVKIAAASLLTMNLLLLIAGALEIHTYWWAGKYAAHRGPEFSARSMNAQFTYSAWAMLFGAVLLTSGFSRRSAFLRWQALVLVAFTITKVFLYDIGRLSQGYRVLSFLGLGALLLGVSFVYQRDLLQLREQKHDLKEL